MAAVFDGLRGTSVSDICVTAPAMPKLVSAIPITKRTRKTAVPYRAVPPLCVVVWMTSAELSSSLADISKIKEARIVASPVGIPLSYVDGVPAGSLSLPVQRGVFAVTSGKVPSTVAVIVAYIPSQTAGKSANALRTFTANRTINGFPNVVASVAFSSAKSSKGVAMSELSAVVALVTTCTIAAKQDALIVSASELFLKVSSAFLSKIPIYKVFSVAVSEHQKGSS